MSTEKIAKMYHGCKDIKVTPSMAFHSHSSKSTITFLMCLLLFQTTTCNVSNGFTWFSTIYH